MTGYRARPHRCVDSNAFCSERRNIGLRRSPRCGLYSAALASERSKALFRLDPTTSPFPFEIAAAVR
jgi:hypothetical protein